MKWLKRLGVVVLALLAVSFGALAIETCRLGREIDARIAAIKAKGDPVSAKDLAPRIPDSQNGALVYERVFAVIEPGMDGISKACGITSPMELRKHPELLAFARTTSAKYRRVLPLIEQATDRPQCRFIDSPDRMSSHLSRVRDISRLLSVIANIDAVDGNMEDSVTAIGLGYRVSRSLGEEPSLIGCIVRFGCIGMTSRSLKQSAQYGDVPELQARRLFDLMGKIDLQAGYVRAMKGELARGLDQMERARNYGFDSSPEGLLIIRSPDGHRPGIGRLLNVRACADELFYLKYRDWAVDTISQPHVSPTPKHVRREPHLPRYAIVSTKVIPWFARSRPNLHESMATVAGDRAFLAVLAYKSRFGGYPSSLSEVEGRLGWKLPLDPLGGGPFHYRREGRGFVLYGVGRDTRDDGGKAVEFGSLDKYPYSDGEGRHSADMIWRKG